MLPASSLSTVGQMLGPELIQFQLLVEIAGQPTGVPEAPLAVATRAQVLQRIKKLGLDRREIQSGLRPSLAFSRTLPVLASTPTSLTIFPCLMSKE
jgi:hypothetical protein